MGSTQVDLQALLEKRDARIRELEMENMELKSKLDKYQSIFSSVEGGPASPGANVTYRFLSLTPPPNKLDRLTIASLSGTV